MAIFRGFEYSPKAFLGLIQLLGPFAQRLFEYLVLILHCGGFLSADLRAHARIERSIAEPTPQFALNNDDLDAILARFLNDADRWRLQRQNAFQTPALPFFPNRETILDRQSEGMSGEAKI